MGFERVDTTDEIVMEAKDLPSTGKHYPRGCKISYKSYTFLEINKLSNDKIPDDVKQSIMLEGINCSFDKNYMSWFDFLYLCLHRKLSSLTSPQFSFSYSCECSSKPITKTFDLMSIAYKDINVDVPVTIDFFSTRQLSFYPLTIMDYNFLVSNDLLFMDNQRNDIAIYSVMAKQEFNEPITMESFKINYKLLSKMTDSRDIELLQIMNSNLDHGLEPFVWTCNNRYISKPKNPDIENDTDTFENCKLKHKTELDGGELLIVPFRGQEYNAKNRIYYGKK